MHRCPAVQPGVPRRSHRSVPTGACWRGSSAVAGTRSWCCFPWGSSASFRSSTPQAGPAGRTRRPLAALWALLYTAAVVAIVAVPPTEIAGPMILGLMVVAAPHSLVLSLRASNAKAPPRQVGPARADTRADPAVFAALSARVRREESRQLAAGDPLLARDLRIGRPDLPRTYDDGGLVDLNNAPVEAIASTCGIEPAVAAQIVNARTAGITFTTVDDVFSRTDIPYPQWDRIRDRAVVING
jgi:hypothetical protein